MPEQHSGKVRHKGTKDKCNIELCAHTLESTKVKVRLIRATALHVP